MSEQPEALRLAETTPSLRGGDWGDRASSELRRLHAEVNEQARLNGMGAEREFALMAKVEAATRARQQAQEALYAERDRHAATVKKMQADLGMRTDESVRYRGVLDATVIVIEEMRQEIESLQAGGREVLEFVKSQTQGDGRVCTTYKLIGDSAGPLKLSAWSPAYTRGPVLQPAPVAAAPGNWFCGNCRTPVPAPIAALVPLSREIVDALMTQHYPIESLLRENVDAFELCVRDIESASAKLNGLTVGDGGTV